MNRTQKKRLFQGLLAMGIVLLVLSLLLDGRVPDSLGGMLCGIGSGLLAMAGSTLLNLRHEAKHPAMARQHDIEDDQVKFLHFQQIGGAFTVVRNDERLAQRFQRHGNQLGNARLVVDDQNWQHGEYLLPVGVRTV